MRKFLIAAVLLTPAVAFALDYSDISSRYSDAPFLRPEAVAISMLTRMSVIGGNPDGTFAAHRTLNRAEFTKIAMLSHPDISVSPSDADDCFPDVRRDDWFSRFVCLAKNREVVTGNPDGTFRPARPVNVAEAITIQVRVWGLPLPQFIRAPDNWYDPYYIAARTIGIEPDAFGSPAHPLTRGEMARLAASFIASMNDDLENYHRAELGLPAISSSSSSAAVSSAQSSSASSQLSSSSQSSSSSSASYAPGFPSRSQFLVAGERSLPVASATFFANLEPMFVQRAEVKLENAIEGIDSMYIVDRDGVELGQISLDKVFDSTEKTWRGTLLNNYRIEKAEQKVIGVVVRMKPREQGGTSEELVEVDTFRLTMEGEWSTDTTTTGTDIGPFPQHQTAMGRITSVRNAQESQAILPLGSTQLASFTVTGSAVSGASLKVEHLEFQVTKSSFVNISNWELGIPDSTERMSCSFNSGTSIVSCSSLPDSLGTLGTLASSRTFRLFGDVSLASGATDKNLQISLNLAGNLSTNGAIRWTDGTGHFNWVELEQPLAKSTIWK